MDRKIEPAVRALVDGIIELLGEPVHVTDKMIYWERGDFEVAVQCDVGPHVWLSADWRPQGQPFREIADAVERYPRDRSRHASLKQTRTLGLGNSARCIKNIGDRVGAVVKCVRACAKDAGVIDSPEVHVLRGASENRVDSKRHGGSAGGLRRQPPRPPGSPRKGRGQC